MSETPVNDRRKAPERRALGERRRGGEGRRVVLHLGRSELRIGLIVRDSRGAIDLLHTTSIDWRGDGPQLPAPEALESLGAELKQVAAAERLAGCTASLILSSDLCVNRVVSGGAGEVRKALDAIDDRSQLYLSLGPGKKTIATAVANLDARHERAVVSVAREMTIQQLINLFTSAGFDLRAIEAETVALARAHGALHKGDEEPVLLVLCDERNFEIAVAHRGSLLLEYRPGAGASGVRVIDLLKQHHARLERYCQRQVSDFGLKLNKVYLAGRPEQVRQAAKEINAAKEFEAELIDTMAARDAWPRAPEEIGVDEAVILGRLLKEIDAAPEAPAPNLIEQWIAESRKHIRPMLIRSSLPLAAVLLIALAGAIANWTVRSDSQSLERQIAELQPLQLEYKTLRLRLIADQDMLARLEQLSAGVEPVGLTRLLASVGGCLPDDVWLDRFSVTDVSAAVVSGASYSESGVYDFVRHLNVAPTFDQVALEGTGFTSTREGPATSFNLKFLLAAPAEGEEASP